MSFLEDAKIVWNYHHTGHELKKVDAMLVFGSIDPTVALRGAELYHEGFAPIVIFTGGVAHTDDLLATDWQGSEAAHFANIAREHGVPDEAILLEEAATNTELNYRYSQKVYEAAGHSFNSFIVVTKPYMERRAYATGKVVWPDKDIVITSPQTPFEEYFPSDAEREKIINLMVGDLHRIVYYPEEGYQIPQEVPEEVRAAFNRLLDAGYDKHLLAYRDRYL